MSKKIKIVIKRVDRPFELVEVDNDLKTLQEIVGGYIEIIYQFPNNLLLVADEEGTLKGKKINLVKSSNITLGVGDMFLVNQRAGNFASLTKTQIDSIKRIFKADIVDPSVIRKE